VYSRVFFTPNTQTQAQCSHTPADISQDGSSHCFFPLMNIDIVISRLSVRALMMQ